jgi:hypothetical protein
MTAHRKVVRDVKKINRLLIMSIDERDWLGEDDAEI